MESVQIATNSYNESNVIVTADITAFLLGLNSKVAEVCLLAINSTRTSDWLTEDKVRKFIINLNPELAWSYLSSMWITKGNNALTNDKVVSNETIKFLSMIGPKCSWEYFVAIGSTHAADVLTDNQARHFISQLDNKNRYRYLKSLNETILAKDAIINSIKYYELLYGKLKSDGQLIKLGFIHNPEFIDAALKNTNNGSLVYEVYNIAIAAYKLNKMGLLNLDLNTLFSKDKQHVSTYFCNEARQIFDNFKIDYTYLGLDEQILLLSDIEFVIANYKNIRLFIKRRKTRIIQRSPFNNLNLGNAIISEKYVSKKKHLSMTYKDALEATVYVLNGSRKEREKAEYVKNLIIKSGYVDEDTINAASGNWKKIRASYHQQLSDNFDRFERSPSKENAIKILDLFKDALKKVDSKNSDPITEFIKKMEPLVTGHKTTMYKGKRILAYVSNKDNLLSITSKNTGVCSFIGGMFSEAAVPYAIDDTIVLLNFGIEDYDVIPDMLRHLRVYGVAMCAFAKMDKNRIPVLFVDSFESGAALEGIMNNNYNIVVKSLKKIAKYTGCYYVAISTNPRNTIARKFVKSIVSKEEYHKIFINTHMRQWLEGTSNSPMQIKLIRSN